MHAIAHGAVRTYVHGRRVCTERSRWEKNPLPHRGVGRTCIRSGPDPTLANQATAKDYLIFVFIIFATAPPCLWGSSRDDHINENGCEKRTWFSNGGKLDANVRLACWAGMTGDNVRPAVGAAPVVYAIVINPELKQFQMSCFSCCRHFVLAFLFRFLFVLL